MWGQPPSAVPPSAARRLGARAGPSQQIHFENHLRTCINQYGPRARHPFHSRPHSPAPRPHPNRRRPASSGSIPGSPLHQPPSLPEPGSDGSSSRHRSSRPAVATSPPPRSSFCFSCIPSHPRTTPPQRHRRSLRHSRRLRRRPPPKPSRNADGRPGRRSLLRHRRHNRPKRPPQTPPLNWTWSSDI